MASHLKSSAEYSNGQKRKLTNHEQVIPIFSIKKEVNDENDSCEDDDFVPDPACSSSTGVKVAKIKQEFHSPVLPEPISINKWRIVDGKCVSEDDVNENSENTDNEETAASSADDSCYDTVSDANIESDENDDNDDDDEASGLDKNQCKKCGKCFTYPTALKKHLQKNTCEKQFTYEESDKSGKLKCKVCGLVYKRVDALRQHVKIHSREKSLSKCVHCDQLFSSRELKIHLKTHEKGRRASSKYTPHWCQDCHECFDSLEELSEHALSHNSRRNKQAGTTPHRYVPSWCRECHQSFDTENDLQEHMLTHDQRRHRTVHQCDDCGKCFTNKENLRNHIKSQVCIRTNECEECNKYFQTSAALSTHMRCKHSDRQYNCGECRQSFDNAKSFRAHQKTHVGETPFRCENCGQNFRYYGSLDHHTTNECKQKAAFVCNICARVFTKEYDLKVHTRIHRTGY